MSIKSAVKLFIYLILILLFATIILTGFYIKGLPYLISNEKVINKAEKIIKEYTNFDIDVQKPVLRTYFKPKLDFSVDLIKINKGNEKIAEISKLNTSFSFNEIFNKIITVNTIGADNIYIDVNKLLEGFKSEEKKEEKTNFDWTIDLFDSVLYLNNSLIKYNPDKTTQIELSADNLSIDNREKIERYVHFNLNGNILKDNKNLKIGIKDDNKVVIKNKHIYVNNCPLTLSKSKVFFNAQADKKDYSIEIYAKKFFINDIIKLLETNIIENNIKESLAPIRKLKGNFDFNIKTTKSDINGVIKLNKLSGELIPLNNMPFYVEEGNITLKGKDIILSDFKGYYANKKSNTMTLEGSVKDYLKTMKTNIILRALLTNDFTSKYLSKAAGVNLTLTGKSQSKTIIDCENNKIDITMMGKISKGDDILVEGASLSPIKYDRAVSAIMHLNGNILNIETIKYFIAKELNKQTQGVKPILTLNGNVNIENGNILNLGFKIPNPLPSEFLNVLIGQKMFRHGNFYGDMEYINTGDYPILKGDLEAEKVLIPTQRMFLKKGSIKTQDELIKIDAEGKYRRCGWIFNGNILNKILFPVIIKNTSLTIDNIDVDRILKAFNSPVQSADFNNEDIENSQDTNMAFDITNVIVEKATVKILKGNYNEITFSNIAADMTLNKNGIFYMTTNLFDIAQGFTNARVKCDLINHKYYLRLGIKEVDSDTIFGGILNLKREIDGKASGLIELNTDESLKLNGRIQFMVANGTIQKIGLIQYILNFASVFRNPITMLSPSIISDIINIPEGNFDKITGDLILKNNVIELMKIKSYSPSLSAFIIGKYNLENSDAILRIYTKFSNRHKGIGGFLRNISLNSLANRIPLKSRNDEHYYAAELEQLPPIDADEKDCQIFVTKVDGDVEHNNFISSLKKIK